MYSPEESSEIGPAGEGPSDERPLLPRQAAFVQEYLIDLNATQAAIRAGYSAKNPTVTGSTLLANPNIAAAIERSKAQRASRVGMTADTVLHEMSLLATARIDHFVLDDEGQVRAAPGAPEGCIAAIKSIKRKSRITRNPQTDEVTREYEVDITLWDKPGSLKLMGRHAGVKAFFEKVEVSGPNGGPIPIQEVRATIVRPNPEEQA